MKKILLFFVILGLLCVNLIHANAQTVFINEIHYDNTGTDTGEAIEIAGPAGTDLSGWSIVLYNGNGGATYGTLSLSGVILDQSNGYGFVTVDGPSSGIQNGAPDGLALVDASNNVIQFLSYEGTMTAVGGPADGMLSTDIGVLEDGSDAVGLSLQLIGTGTNYSDFSWQAPTTSSFGSINTGQVFGTGVSTIPTQPTNLTATNITQTTVDLSWTASTDDVGVTAYLIFKDDSKIDSISELTYSVTGLTAGTAYTFKVVAVDGDNNNSSPAEITLTTLSDVVVTTANVFINEIHYDNASTDVGEAIEVAGTAGTDLSGWSLVLYNGSGGAVYGTIALSGMIPDQDAGYGTLSFEYSGIQNGAPDGVALVDASGYVIQFLSYEGSFTAVGGVADGMTSEDIGVEEGSSTAVGSSLQLTGLGTTYADFVWQSGTATFGSVNTDQYFSYPVFVNEIHYDNYSTDEGEAIEVAGPAGFDLTGWTLVLYNGNGGAAYNTISLSGIFSDQDNGYGTLSFATEGIQNGSPDGIALIEPAGSVVQFLSYEGSFEATDGPALGLTSEDIGVTEGSSTVAGYSLQLTGTGTRYIDFVWSSPMTSTFGAVNTDQSFGGVVEPPVNELITIAEARQASEGSTVTISGILTVSDQFAGAAYMQDTTAGIAVYDAQVYGDGIFEIGDSITITGKISIYNGLVEVKELTSVNDHGPAVYPIEPKITTLAELNLHASELVTVVNASFPEPGQLLFGNTNFELTDGSGIGEMRLDADVEDLVGLAQPMVCEVTGVVSLYDTIYQLMPRMKVDLPCATEFTTDDGLGISKDLTLDVACWNIEWFGDSGTNSPADDDVQKDSVKAVLLALDADIIGVEEISDDSLFVQLVSEMPGYAGVLSDATSYPDSDGDKQKVGFIYKTATIGNVSTKVLLESAHPYYNGGDASYLTDYPDEDATRFFASGRLPFMLTADVTIGGVTEKMSFIDLHARANSADYQEKYNMRKYDVEALKDTLDAQYADQKIIMVGDYNDDLDETVADITSTTVSTYQAYVDDAGNYSFPTRALSDEGYRSYAFYPNMIDHVMLTDELFENYIDGSAKVHYEFYDSDYTSTTSDHFPVSVRLQVASLELVSILQTENDCAGGSNATATVEVQGGIPPYSYLWSDGQTTATADSLAAGTYNVTVKDALGAEVSAEVELTDPDPIEIVLSGDAVVYPAYADSACTTLSVIDLFGGSGMLSFEWSTGETSESIVVCPLEETVYTFTVSDENGCVASGSVIVTPVDVLCTEGNGQEKIEICYHGKSLCVAYNSIDEHLRNGATLGACSVGETETVAVNLESVVVYPNPVKNNCTLAFTSEGEADAQLLITSGGGAVVYSEEISIHEAYNTVILKLKDLAPGTYVVSVLGTGVSGFSETIVKQ